MDTLFTATICIYHLQIRIMRRGYLGQCVDLTHWRCLWCYANVCGRVDNTRVKLFTESLGPWS